VASASSAKVLVVDDDPTARYLVHHQLAAHGLRLLAAQPFWEDRIAQTLALAAAAMFFAMFAYVYQQYPGLSQSIELSFPQLDGVTRVGSKSELLKLPMTGVGLLMINLALGFIAHSWERMVGYVLLLAAIGAEAILLAAAIIALN
jgi:CheY-like chemotaxis protein